MIDLSALQPVIILIALITIPAIIVFSVVTYIRMRKQSFRYKRSSDRRSRPTS